MVLPIIEQIRIDGGPKIVKLVRALGNQIHPAACSNTGQTAGVDTRSNLSVV